MYCNVLVATPTQRETTILQRIAQGGNTMDMFKMLSIDGFVDYYLQYCTRIDELSKAERILKKAGKEDESSAKAKEMLRLLNEFHFALNRYAIMCTLNELQKALDAYPKDSREHLAVETVMEKKQTMLNTMKQWLGF